MKKLTLLWLGVSPLIIAVSPSPQASPAVPAGCPAPADPLTLIPGLRTAQVVTEGATTTMRFSSDERACGPWSNEVRGGDCLDHWTFQIALPIEALTPGTYQLGKIGASFGDLLVRANLTRGGCESRCGTGVTGIGSTAIEDSEATLVIDSVADGCIAGTIRDLRDPHFDDAPDFNGAFYAVRCAP